MEPAEQSDPLWAGVQAGSVATAVTVCLSRAFRCRAAADGVTKVRWALGMMAMACSSVFYTVGAGCLDYTPTWSHCSTPEMLRQMRVSLRWITEAGWVNKEQLWVLAMHIYHGNLKAWADTTSKGLGQRCLVGMLQEADESFDPCLSGAMQCLPLGGGVVPYGQVILHLLFL